jgi:uncharacterized protein
MNELPSSNRVAAAFELLLAVLLITGSFAPVPFGNTIALLFLASISLWLRETGWGNIGLRRPKSWPQAIIWGIALGVAAQIFDLSVTTPLLARITGHAPDLSGFRSLIGNVQQLLFWLAVTWSIAAFGEEMVYRGYILNRTADLFGGTRLAWVFATIVSCACFGLGHRYQGLAGVVDIAVSAVVPVIVYRLSGRNLWAIIVMHGVNDTIGFVLIFFHRYPGL